MVISLFLLALLALIVEGLIASEKITFSAISMPDFSSMLAESFEYLIFLAFFAIAVGSLVVMILDRDLLVDSIKNLLRHPKDSEAQSMRRKLLVWVAGFGIILMLVFAFTWFRMHHGAVDGLKLENGQSNGETPSEVPAVPESPPALSTLLIVSGVILVAAVFVGSLLFIQAAKEVRQEAEAALMPEEEETLQEKAAAAVGEAISEIKAQESDLSFRAAIIKCYERLCELLAQHGCQIQKHETAREFMASASKLLNIPDKPFSALTNLFEEARYSLHEIDEAKRNEALKCLEEINKSLIGGKP